MCEEELKKYTAQFNNQMGIVGFQVEYKVLDKVSVGVIYGLTMTYKDLMLHHGDVLIHSMYVAEEIITNIKTLLHDIQV